MTISSSFDFSNPLGLVLVMDTLRDYTEMADEALLERALKSPSAFEALVARYQREFLDRAFFVVKSRDEAEDVVQDTFVRIYRFAPRFSASHGTFKAWAVTILMNVARTRYQKQAKEWGRTATLESEHYESLAEPSGEEAHLARDTVERALAQVPKDVAGLLRLAFLDGLPYAEIAEREGMTEGAVKTRVHRAKKVLRQVIDQLDI
jgi:RNA polymerase sigma-70 factor, ECF subfamily